MMESTKLALAPNPRNQNKLRNPTQRTQGKKGNLYNLWGSAGNATQTVIGSVANRERSDEITEDDR